MPKVIQNHNIKPQNPLCNGKNLVRKQNLITFLPLSILALITAISFLTLSSSSTSAESHPTASAVVNVGIACTLSGSTTEHAISGALNGQYNTVDGTTLRTVCNGNGNYDLHAIGYTNDTAGNNVLYNANGSINTGVYPGAGKVTSDTPSSWSMKLAYQSGSGSADVIKNGYSSYSTVPSTSTLVASYGATSESSATDSTLATSYEVYVSPTQHAGTYTGQVKYTLSYTALELPYMQNITSATLAALLPNVGDTTTLYDSRDGSAYLVGKLADGNYWMLDNLALDLTNPVVINRLSANNTNADNTSLWYLRNGGRAPSGRRPAPTDRYATSSVSKWGESINFSYSDPLVALSGECYEEDYYCVNSPADGQWSYDAITEPTMSDTTSYYQGKIGVYYNYCAATAGTFCYGNGIGYGRISGEVTGDICPKAWRLPTGDSGDLQTLYTAYGNDAEIFQKSLHTPLSGSVNNDIGMAALQGHSGYFWASSIFGETGTKDLYVTATSVSYTGTVNRGHGASIRCIFDPRN